MNYILCYIDPGSSSYIVQALVAAFVGFIFYFKTIWFRVKELVGLSKNKITDIDNSDEDPKAI